jgi:multisubunit Na+/H+ antiporter MnhB subunit
LRKIPHDDDVRLTAGRVLILGMALALTLSLAAVALTFPDDQPRLAQIALQRVPESGVNNPVTAVLLNFRGYDTLLEVAVLLLAIVGIWSMARTARVQTKRPDTPILGAFVRFVVPLMAIVAGYLLWLGADEPGGAFQGGAVLGGMGILWIAAAVWLPRRGGRALLRPLLTIGLAAFLLAATWMLFVRGNFFEYPPGQAKELILLIEGAAMLSIGATLALLFVGGAPEAENAE